MRDKIPDAVCWQEGMRLAPQHFEQQALRHDRLHAHLLAIAQPFFWGWISVNPILGGSILRISNFIAIMPDGNVIEHSTMRGDIELSIDLAKQASDRGNFEISLVLASSSASAVRRNLKKIESTEVFDQAGTRSVNVNTWRPELELVCGVPAGYAKGDLLPLVRCTFKLGVFDINKEYIPPCPHIASNANLQEKIQGICTLLRAKYALFANKWIARKTVSVMQEQPQREAERLMRNQWMLSVLGAHLMELEGLYALGNTSAHTVFQSLLRLLGALSATMRMPACPVSAAFDYRDLWQSIENVWLQVKENLEQFLPPFDTFYFNRDGESKFSLTLADIVVREYLIIGLVPPSTASATDMINWLNKTAIGAAPRIATLMANRTRGLARRALNEKEASVYEAYHTVILFELTVGDADILKNGDSLVIADGTRDTPGALMPKEILLFHPSNEVTGEG